MKTSTKQKGFSRLDLLLIVLALAGIALVILPRLARSRISASKTSCVYHLKQVGLSFRIWAGDNNDKYPQQIAVTNGGAMEWAEQGSAYHVFLAVSNELNTPQNFDLPGRKQSPAPRGKYVWLHTNNWKHRASDSLHRHQQLELLRWLGR